MNSPIFSTPPLRWMSSSMFSAASLAPPCAGPHRQATPAAMAAKGLVPELPHSRTVEVRGVLLVVGMQDEDAVHRPHQHVVGHVVLAGRGEHHAHEVAGVAELVARVHVGLAHAVLVGHGHQRGHLGDQPDGGDVAVARIVDVGAVVIEGRQRADQAGHHRHRVRVAAEAAQEELHLLVDHRVVVDELVEVLLLRRRSAARRTAAGSRCRGSRTAWPVARSGSRGTATRPCRRRCR